MKITFLVSIWILTFCRLAYANTDTVRVPDARLLTQQLKPGSRQYLVYMKGIAPAKTMFLWYWIRDIRVKRFQGKRVFAIQQRWLAADSNNYRSILSINRQDDFHPIYHEETVRALRSAYNWNDQQITGADSVAQNMKKKFKLVFAKPSLNWNLDMETFEMLPLSKNKVFAIQFYDAGLEPPKEIIYKVIGSERILTFGKSLVDCWKLYTEGEYNHKKYSETYWISKKDHEMLKEEDDLGNGTYRCKIKLPATNRLMN